jgi:hypothetical protein
LTAEEKRPNSVAFNTTDTARLDSTDLVDSIDRPFSAPINAKLTTSGGITVSYNAPALPRPDPAERPESSASIPLTWSTIDDEEEEVNVDEEDYDSNPDQESYTAFLAPYGQVHLDPDLDLEPQVLAEEEEESSPDYSQVYDSYGQLLDRNGTSYLGNPDSDPDPKIDDADEYPSSWDDDDEEEEEDEEVLLEQLNLDRPVKNSTAEEPWSDIGQSVNSSFEFWKTKDKLKPVQPAKLFDTKYQHNNRYASDSNINDAVDMTEPGLRKILKSTCSTTSSSCETTFHVPSPLLDEDIIEEEEVTEEPIYYSISDDLDHQETGEQENIYSECLDPDPESGFFSYVAVTKLSPKSQTVTCIPINHRDESTSSSSEDYVCNVTVNGKIWINPSSSTSYSYDKPTNKTDQTWTNSSSPRSVVTHIRVYI